MLIIEFQPLLYIYLNNLAKFHQNDEDELHDDGVCLQHIKHITPSYMVHMSRNHYKAYILLDKVPLVHDDHDGDHEDSIVLQSHLSTTILNHLDYMLYDYTSLVHLGRFPIDYVRKIYQDTLQVDFYDIHHIYLNHKANI